MNYQKIYEAICQRGKDELEERKRKKRDGLEYYEGHHIIPESQGGEGDSRTWNHSNITPLTAREHFIAHKILHSIYPEDNKLLFALWAMCNQKGKNQKREYVVYSNEYERLKKESSINFSKTMRGVFSGDKNPMFGKKGEEAPAFGRVGKKHPMYGKTSPNAKKVIKLDLHTGKVLETYNSATEAGIMCGLDSSGISKVCKGGYGRKSLGGFIWKYLI
jgi:hypothetical protein